MKSVRLIPVVILAVSALLVLKTLGLMTTGSYVLGGVASVRAEEAAPKDGETMTLPAEPTMADDSPTLDDGAPTLGKPAAEGGNAAAPAGEDKAAEGHAAAPADAPADSAPSPTAESGHKAVADDAAPGLQPVCPPTESGAATPVAAPADAAAHGAQPAAAPVDAALPAVDASADFAATVSAPDCATLVDGTPARINPDGTLAPLVGENGQSASEKTLLERLTARRTELETYQQELDLRASLVDAAEKKIEERQATLQALETQISTLVDQRKDMETGQFSGIITLYENMKPKDAAAIFNSLDMEVLLRVAKGMNPRKMSPILAAMDATRAQELTVRMAALADQPPEEMTPADLSALPQIVGH